MPADSIAAAAPAMLAALELALPHIPADAMVYSEGTHGDRVYIADRVRAAIAAAKLLAILALAVLCTLAPGGADAAGFDPGFARAGADPASNAFALAAWFAALAFGACAFLACAGTVRHGRRERDAAALRVRCRVIAGR